MNRPAQGEKKLSARFDFVDAIIAGALIIAAFIILVGVFSTKAPVNTVLEVRLTDRQREFYRENGLTVDAGSEVRDFETNETIGVLYARYEAGKETLQVLVKTGRDEKNAVKCGETVSLTVGKMIVCDAQITDVRKDG